MQQHFQDDVCFLKGVLVDLAYELEDTSVFDKHLSWSLANLWCSGKQLSPGKQLLSPDKHAVTVGTGCKPQVAAQHQGRQAEGEATGSGGTAAPGPHSVADAAPHPLHLRLPRLQGKSLQHAASGRKV